MGFRLQIILIIIWTVVLVYLTNQMKKKKVDIKYTLSWLLLDIVLLIVSIWPGLLNFITNLFGIVTPVNMLFFVGLLFTLVIIYTQTIALSKMTDRVKKLAQQVALDEYREKLESDKIKK